MLSFEFDETVPCSSVDCPHYLNCRMQCEPSKLTLPDVGIYGGQGL